MDIDQMMKDGWVYRDLPRMTEGAMEKILSVIGEENVKWLTRARYPNTEHGVAVRGQILINPQGMQNLMLEKAKNAKETT